MPAPTDRRPQRGFTILELVVTVFVMAILAAIAIPSTSMSAERKLDTLQLQIQDAMDYASDLAYRTGSKHAVVFNVPGQYIAVINELMVPEEDPLTRKPFIIRLTYPDQPDGVRIDEATFVDRPLAPFDEKGVLTKTGIIKIGAGNSLRWFQVNTSTAELEEVPITEG